LLKTIHRHKSNQEMLDALKALLARRGALSTFIIDDDPDCPPAQRYWWRFGSLGKAYELIGYQAPKNYRHISVNRRLDTVKLQVIQDFLAEVEKRGAVAAYEAETGLVWINEEITVAIAIARCRVSHFGYPRWFSKADRQPLSDIFVLIRMSPGDLTIRDYLIAPVGEIAGKPDLHAHNGARLDSFVFPTLTPLVVLAERAAVEMAI
jgi:hypothetical protein